MASLPVRHLKANTTKPVEFLHYKGLLYAVVLISERDQTINNKGLLYFQKFSHNLGFPP